MLVDLLSNLRPTKVIDKRTSQIIEKLASLGFGEENVPTVFADFLENRYNKPEVANMESRQWESHVAKVAIAPLQSFMTSRTFSGFARCTLIATPVSFSSDNKNRLGGVEATHQLDVEGTVLVRSSVVFDIIQKPVGDFGHSLIRYILVRPVENIINI